MLVERSAEFFDLDSHLNTDTGFQVLHLGCQIIELALKRLKESILEQMIRLELIVIQIASSLIRGLLLLL